MRSPKERAADPLPTVVFSVFTVTGVGYIIGAKALGLSSFAVTGGPVLLMLAYAVMIIVFRGLRLRADQTGDNFYYMGFIFTLVSLGVSLYLYSSGGGVDEIIRNFGVAVSSTIFGIVLRIMFTQMRRDPIEVEQAARLDLADAARRVRRELDGVQYEIAHFRRTSQQREQESFDETRKQLAAVREAAIEAIQSARTAFSGGLNEAVREVSEHYLSPEVKQQLDKYSKSLNRITAKVEAGGTELSSAMEALVSNLSKAQTPDKIIEVSMQPVVEGLQKAITDAAVRISHQITELNRLTAEVAQSSKVREATTAELSAALRSIDEVQTWIASQRRGGLFGMWGRRESAPSSPLDGTVPSNLGPTDPR